jgi:ketosteroid isomerase-like protein
MSAIERFLAALHARETAAVSEQLADDVEFRVPPADEPIVGRDAVAAALGLLQQLVAAFNRGAVGVDVVELDADGRVTRMTASVHPVGVPTREVVDG